MDASFQVVDCNCFVVLASLDWEDIKEYFQEMAMEL